eukprot:CAMPEP_0116906354 /NCGR_PEP_ID=MMETSP0467-20121206/12478_1 /TAXON_ID=283647 /ORGANISM="Mesodinium pulex, Strain SPMC105" /LENGTH=76 /DNA_ID=CAMNT_0004581201 /DNA_START=516 /DNA_END=746 /DNA_ORIENTATION=-
MIDLVNSLVLKDEDNFNNFMIHSLGGKTLQEYNLIKDQLQQALSELEILKSKVSKLDEENTIVKNNLSEQNGLLNN